MSPVSSPAASADIASPKLPTCYECRAALKASEVRAGVCAPCERDIMASFADADHRPGVDFDRDALACASDAHGLDFGW